MYIRPATPQDADAIARLYSQFVDYLRSLGDSTDFRFSAAIYLREGFGPNPAFAGIVAEVADQVVGYLLYHWGYDTDRAIRVLHVIDLFVDPGARGQGIGKALMHRAAQLCRDAGGSELFWAVYKPNNLAADFYQRLGAHYVEDLDYMAWSLKENR